MKKTKSFLSFLSVITVVMIVIAGCTKPVAKTPIAPIKVGSYYFQPPEVKEKNSISLALIHATNAATMEFSDAKIFTNFANHFSEDLQQLVTSNGYYFRGPFESVPSMVYNDKQSCMLYLLPEINISIDESNLKLVRFQAPAPNYKPSKKVYIYTHKFDGEIVLSGRVTMTFGETFTKEKIQTFSIPLQSKSVYISSNFTYANEISFKQALRLTLNNIKYTPDPGIVNPIVTVLEEYYVNCFKTIQDQINKKQVELYLVDAEKIRKDANYFKH